MFRHRGKVILLASACLAVALIVVLMAATASSIVASDWRSDWAVRRGFEVLIDAQGFQFPTSIAFVRSPGNLPKDPIYFVTELKGAVKVVTNDRTVFTFAEGFFSRKPKRAVPAIDDEVGLAGICLDDENGYVFVTFAYHDDDNIQRNNVVRFQSKPDTFTLAPLSQVEFTEMFAPYPSTPSHQIGGCQVRGEHLYVNVADAGGIAQSQQIDSLLGKVLRMTLDGLPANDNPFYQDDDIGKAANYVWAYGFRNPFGLKLVGDRVFVGDNGPDIDRFLQVDEGGNYLWDGSNFSMGAKAKAVFSPGRGMAQMDYYPRDSNFFPNRFKDSFFVTVTASPARHRDGIPAIFALGYDLAQSTLLSVPTAFLRYRGDQVQVIAGLGFGPDGLYFAPLFPNKDGLSAVLKVVYEPTAEYPHILEDELNPIVLLNTYGCFACHTLNNNQGGTVGPVLDRDLLIPRLERRLSSQEYADTVGKLDSLDQEPFNSFRDARRMVEEAEGLEKIRLWLEYRIQEPRFDDPNAQMPNLGLTADQSQAIAKYLAGIQQEAQQPASDRRFYRKIIDAIKDRLPIATRANAEKFLAVFFGLGIFVGIVAALASYWVLVRIRRRRDRRSAGE